MKHLRFLLPLLAILSPAWSQTAIPVAKDGAAQPGIIYTVPVSGLDSSNKAQMLSTDSAGHTLTLKPPVVASSSYTATSAANAAVTLTLPTPTTAWELSSLQVCTGGGTIATLAPGTSTLTSNNTNVSDGDQAVIDTKTYTFKTALTPTEGQVLIGGSADASLLNLIRAINHSGTPGTDYSCAAAHPTVKAATSVTSHTFAITSLIPGSQVNAIATTTPVGATLSWTGTTLASGAGINVQVKDGTTIVKNLTIAAIGQDKFVFDPPIVMTSGNALTITAGVGGSGVITSINADVFQQ